MAQFDPTFELTEIEDPQSGPGGITGHPEYATDLFRPETALGMVRDLGVVLRLIVAQPGRRITRLTRDLPCT